MKQITLKDLKRGDIFYFPSLLTPNTVVDLSPHMAAVLSKNRVYSIRNNLVCSSMEDCQVYTPYKCPLCGDEVLDEQAALNISCEQCCCVTVSYK